jgi:endonuclease/exonuclease/phosphatase family metal-dependent hydrolase
LLSRLRPGPVTEHKLPGLPGRGAVVVEIPLADGEQLAIGIVHLALGWRARKRQLNYLAGLAEEHPLLVLMGDFNCGSDSRSLRAMVRRTGMQGLDYNLKTFPSWRPRHNLDHILVTQPLRILNAHVIDYPLSDHLPLSMTLGLPEGLGFAEPADLRGTPFNPVHKNDANQGRKRR